MGNQELNSFNPMGTIWFIIILLAIPRFSFARLRKSDSLPIADYSFHNELLFSDPPTFLLDSVDRSEQEITHAEFNTPFQEFRKALMTNREKYFFWIRFAIRNNTDSILNPYFYFGNLNKISLYFESAGHKIITIKGGNLIGIDKAKPYIEQSSLSFPLILQPRQYGEVYVRIKQKTAEYRIDTIQIYNRQFLYASFGEAYEKMRYFIFFQILFISFVLCQMIYSLLQWIITRNKEYLYYCFYLFTIAVYFLSKRETDMGIDVFFSIYPAAGVYLNKALIILPYFFYFRFVRYFLEMDHFYPVINKWFIRTENFLLCYLGFDFILIGFHFRQKLQAEIYTAIISLVFCASVIFILYLFTQRKRLINYILSGSLFVAIGNITGLLFTYLHDYGHVQFSFNDFLIFSQTGILIELFCFTSGLSYKGKLNEKEKIKNQARLIEQLKTNEVLRNRVYSIRNKIARDLHDDIGATLSTIIMYSNTAKKKAINPEQGEVLSIIQKIGKSASQMIDEMNDIVWTINPKNDDMEKIVNRMRLLALSLSAPADIVLSFHTEEDIIHQKIPMDKRKDFFLIFKEALNNAIKYSGCTEIKISLTKNSGFLEMTISDNGKGFDLQHHREGNGLGNMAQRAEEISGRLAICPEPGKGTSILLSFPV